MRLLQRQRSGRSTPLRLSRTRLSQGGTVTAASQAASLSLRWTRPPEQKPGGLRSAGGVSNHSGGEK